jgi:hypothetical protein
MGGIIYLCGGCFASGAEVKSWGPNEVGGTSSPHGSHFLGEEVFIFSIWGIFLFNGICTHIYIL